MSERTIAAKYNLVIFTGQSSKELNGGRKYVEVFELHKIIKTSVTLKTSLF